MSRDVLPDSEVGLKRGNVLVEGCLAGGGDVADSLRIVVVELLVNFEVAGLAKLVELHSFKIQ